MDREPLFSDDRPVTRQRVVTRRRIVAFAVAAGALAASGALVGRGVIDSSAPRDATGAEADSSSSRLDVRGELDDGRVGGAGFGSLFAALTEPFSNATTTLGGIAQQTWDTVDDAVEPLADAAGSALASAFDGASGGFRPSRGGREDEDAEATPSPSPTITTSPSPTTEPSPSVEPSTTPTPAPSPTP